MYYYLSQWVKSGHYNTENEIRIKYPAIKKMTKSEINRTDKTYFKKKTYGWHLYTAFKKVFKISSDHRTVLDLRHFDYNSLVSFSLEPEDPCLKIWRSEDVAHCGADSQQYHQGSAHEVL